MAKKVDALSFTTTPEEAALIDQIVDRAEAYFQHLDKLRMTMDLTAVHANGTPLDFAALLAADEYTFAVDLSGITRNIDRDTGKLGGFWRPKYVRREP